MTTLDENCPVALMLEQIEQALSSGEPLNQSVINVHAVHQRGPLSEHDLHGKALLLLLGCMLCDRKDLANLLTDFKLDFNAVPNYQALMGVNTTGIQASWASQIRYQSAGFKSPLFAGDKFWTHPDLPYSWDINRPRLFDLFCFKSKMWTMWLLEKSVPMVSSEQYKAVIAHYGKDFNHNSDLLALFIERCGITPLSRVLDKSSILTSLWEPSVGLSDATLKWLGGLADCQSHVIRQGWSSIVSSITLERFFNMLESKVINLNLNERDDVGNPFIVALMHRGFTSSDDGIKWCQRFKQLGADLNIQDHDGKTVLHVLAEHKHWAGKRMSNKEQQAFFNEVERMASGLIGLGANPFIREHKSQKMADLDVVSRVAEERKLMWQAQDVRKHVPTDSAPSSKSSPNRPRKV